MSLFNFLFVVANKEGSMNKELMLSRWLVSLMNLGGLKVETALTSMIQFHQKVGRRLQHPCRIVIHSYLNVSVVEIYNLSL